MKNDSEQTPQKTQLLAKRLDIDGHVFAIADAVRGKILKMEFPPHEPRLQGIVLGLLDLAVRRFRATCLLCDKGFVIESEILLRSLFELKLAARFVLRPPPASTAHLPKDARDVAEMLSKPGRTTTMAFRADLYFVAGAIKNYQLAKDLETHPAYSDPETMAKLRGPASRKSEVEKLIGPEWFALLQRKKNYSGIRRVRDLIEYCGDKNIYDLYNLQSRPVHGEFTLSEIHSVKSSNCMEAGPAFLGAILDDFDVALALNLRNAIQTFTERLAIVVSEPQQTPTRR